MKLLKELMQLEEGKKAKPTNPELWEKAKAQARQKFDVYPCVTMDTDCLTHEGWKSYHDLSIGDDICTYNIQEDFLEWQPIEELFFFENAPIIRLFKSNTCFDIKCTPNHKWVIKQVPRRGVSNYKEKDYKYPDCLVETKNITNRMKIINTAKLKNYSNNEIVLENFHKKNIDWVKRVLSMNSQMRRGFLAGSIVCDGHINLISEKLQRTSYGFTQKDRNIGDAVALAAFLEGHYVSFRPKKDMHGNYSMTDYSFIDRKYSSTQNLLKEDAGNADVWCPRTKNSTWVMRQNKFITITANSAYANAWASKWYKGKGGGWK